MTWHARTYSWRSRWSSAFTSARRQICMSVGAGSPERLSWLPCAFTLPSPAASADANICLYRVASLSAMFHGLAGSSAGAAGGGAAGGGAAGSGAAGGGAAGSMAGGMAIGIELGGGAAPPLIMAAKMACGTAAGISCPLRARLM